MGNGETDSNLYLIGFRIEPDIFDPQIYTIYVNGDRPMMFQGQAILFTRAELAAFALSKSDCGAAAIGPAPTELYAVFDITESICTLLEKDDDAKSTILNLINIVLDFANCMNIKMPAVYRKNLELLADHLTFNNTFEAFLKEHELVQNEIVDALYWSIGMIMYCSKIINE